MLTIISESLRGSFSMTLFAANTVFWCLPLFVVAGVKAVVPVAAWTRMCNRVLNGIAENWIWVNNMNQKWTAKTRLDVQGIETLQRSGWYLILANHRSWVDVLVLQRIFYRKIPFLKFFIKKELFWLPILGQAWWAMDFPFIRRYSRRFLQKNPHLQGKDLEITRKACAKFKKIPLSITNFVEGTRFTTKKHRRQHSPYTNLLKPKAGGIAYVLGAMGDQIQHILDVTIVYPDGAHSFWGLVTGKIKTIKIKVRKLTVTPDLMGDYSIDSEFRDRLQDWLNGLWAQKDRTIQQMMNPSPATN